MRLGAAALLTFLSVQPASADELLGWSLAISNDSIGELKAVFDPRGGAWMGGKYVPSILAAIGGVIERHMIETGFIAGEGMGLKADPQADVVNLGNHRGPACPRCGQYELRMVEGCMTCASCGHSKCG